MLREFGFLIGFTLPILIGWFLPAIGGHSFKLWTLWIGFPTIFVAIIKPLLLFYPYKIWMKVGDILGWINSHLILGFIFIVILIPISIAMKIIGYDPLRLKKHRQKSYREIKVESEVNLRKIF